MNRLVVCFAGLWGLSGIVLAAVFDHALAGYRTHGVETALRYHQLYAVLIMAIGLAMGRDGAQCRLFVPALFFIAGSVTFCMALYLAGITGIAAFNYATPVGGVLMMAGWALLAFNAFSR